METSLCSKNSKYNIKRFAKVSRVLGVRCLGYAFWQTLYFSYLTFHWRRKYLQESTLGFRRVGSLWHMAFPIRTQWRFTVKFILGKLPRHKDEWFVDAADHGYGGVCGNSYFRISHTMFLRSIKSATKIKFTDMFIAYRELLAVLLAFQVFSRIAPNCFIRINSDNSNVVSWINKGRCSKRRGFLLLSAIEYFKFKFGLKVKAFYIKSQHNTSADLLSRGHTPHWLGRRGIQLENDVNEIIKLLDNPLPFWQTKKRNYPL